MKPLGVGLPYFEELPPDLYRGGAVDFVEITPEALCRQERSGLRLLPDKLARAQETCAALPIVVHGVELSIGSAHGCNAAYLDLLDRFQKLWPFLWHSEHLGFQTIPGENAHSLNTGVPLPLPPTVEAAELVAERSASIAQRYGVPFLLENAAHYLPDLPSDPEIGDDIGLMNAIVARSGCLQLLDLHNVWCNAVNHRHDPFAAIDRMPLDRVGEIHVAGGAWADGFWMDAHDSRVPEPVWDILEYTLPRTPNVGGVVFELLADHAVRLGADVIADELARARVVCRRHGLDSLIGRISSRSRMFPTSAASMSDRNRVNPISVGEPLHTSPENALGARGASCR